MADDLLSSPIELTTPIEPVGNREGNTLGGDRKERKPRPPVREKASGEEAEPLEALEADGAAEPHELDEMA